MLAIWNDVVIADSRDTVVVEGNHYFPPESIKDAFFELSNHRTTCPWKGKAHYYDIVVQGDRNEDAAWYYPEPKEKAVHIKDHVAFWNGVQVVEAQATE